MSDNGDESQLSSHARKRLREENEADRLSRHPQTDRCVSCECKLVSPDYQDEHKGELCPTCSDEIPTLITPETTSDDESFEEWNPREHLDSSDSDHDYNYDAQEVDGPVLTRMMNSAQRRENKQFQFPTDRVDWSETELRTVRAYV